jgi:hypothetical protein
VDASEVEGNAARARELEMDIEMQISHLPGEREIPRSGCYGGYGDRGGSQLRPEERGRAGWVPDG